MEVGEEGEAEAQGQDVGENVLQVNDSAELDQAGSAAESSVEEAHGEVESQLLDLKGTEEDGWTDEPVLAETDVKKNPIQSNHSVEQEQAEDGGESAEEEAHEEVETQRLDFKGAEEGTWTDEPVLAEKEIRTTGGHGQQQDLADAHEWTEVRRADFQSKDGGQAEERTAAENEKLANVSAEQNEDEEEHRILAEENAEESEEVIPNGAGDNSGGRDLVASSDITVLGIAFSTLPPLPVVVKRVKEGTWAHRQGIEEGDIFAAVNGQNVKDMTGDIFKNLLRERPLTIRLFQAAGQELQAESRKTVFDTELDDTLLDFVVGSEVDKIGLVFCTQPPKPLVVKRVMEGTWADAMGIVERDVFVAVNGRSVVELTKDELIKMMQRRPLVLRKGDAEDGDAEDDEADEESEASQEESSSWVPSFLRRSAQSFVDLLDMAAPVSVLQQQNQLASGISPHDVNDNESNACQEQPRQTEGAAPADDTSSVQQEQPSQAESHTPGHTPASASNSSSSAVLPEAEVEKPSPAAREQRRSVALMVAAHAPSLIAASASSQRSALAEEAEQPSPTEGDAPASGSHPSSASAAASPEAEAGECAADESYPEACKVWLHVYDLRGLESTNDNLVGMGFGIFHTGVEVYGIEWSYGYIPNPPPLSGVYPVWPKRCPIGTHRESIPLGPVREHSAKDVWSLIQNLGATWLGKEYHLIRHNCHHFCSEFCESLGVSRLPGWVCRLAVAADYVLLPVLEAFDVPVMPVPPPPPEAQVAQAPPESSATADSETAENDSTSEERSQVARIIAMNFEQQFGWACIRMLICEAEGDCKAADVDNATRQEAMAFARRAAAARWQSMIRDADPENGGRDDCNNM